MSANPAAAGQAPAAAGLEHFTARRPLTADADRWLKDGLARMMPDLAMADLFRMRPCLFQETDDLVVATDPVSGGPLGALGTRWLRTRSGVRFLHIAVQFIAASWRGGTLFADCWLTLLKQLVQAGEFPRVSALKTYNPVAYCAMRSYGRLPGSAFFPEIAGPEDSEIRRLAAEIAAALAPAHSFDHGSGVIAGVGVPRDLYVNRPRCDVAEVNAFFERNTGPGDRVLCVVHVRDPAVEEAIMTMFAKRTGQAGHRAGAAGSPAGG